MVESKKVKAIVFESLESFKKEGKSILNTFSNMNFFHTEASLKFFLNQGNEVVSVAIKRDDTIVAMISSVIFKEKGIKSFFSKRAIVMGGPVWTDDISEDEVNLLLSKFVKALEKKVIYIEIRNYNSYKENIEQFTKNKFTYIPHLNFHLDCTSEEVVRKNMSKSKMRQIKKSLKSGAEIIEASSEKQIIDYYEILNDLYKTKVKKPLQDLNFFLSLYNQNIAKFLLIKFNDAIIGGIVTVIHESKVIYEWYVCGKDHVNKNVYPSVLATWSAIDYAFKNNIERFDFMGAGKPDEDYGVREFKSKFGGELVEHGRFIYITNPLRYRIGVFGLNMMSKLKK